MTFFHGLYTALVTPFQADGSLDQAALNKLIDRQIAAGVQGLVMLGTTGESPTLTHDEKIKIIETAVSRGKGKIQIVAGIGTYNTAESVAFAQEAARLGVDALMAVTPYYSKPTQEGLFRHFSAIADATPLPLMLYNIKGRSAQNIEAATVLRLAQHPHIQGVKEASADLDQAMRIMAEAPAGFSVLAGDDAWAFSYMALGGAGLVSVIANLRPTETLAIVNAAARGDFVAARRAHFALLPLMSAMFLETNPQPVKTAMAAEGLCAEQFRLPLCPMGADAKAKLLAALQVSRKQQAA